MAFAPQSNDRLTDATGTQVLPRVLGQFDEKVTGNYFDFSERLADDVWFAAEFPHRIYLDRGQTRIARVLRTVVYVVVDEDETGLVVEKWSLKARRDYD